MKLKNFIRRCLFPIRIFGSGNKCNIKKPKSRKNFIIYIRGNNNFIDIDEMCILENTQITIVGDNNHLIIDKTARFLGPCKILMEGNSILHIGRNAGIRGVDFLLSNANISIGESCMFSYGIILRNHDSHKVIDTISNQIVNLSKDINIEKHVWIGQNCSILKGVTIGQDSIIALGAVVTKSCGSNCILAGNPAKVVKSNILWDY